MWRPQAKVSVLDSGFMLGDGVWEGIRVHRGVMAFAEQHLERLYEGAKALDMDLGLSRAQLAGLVYDTLDANGMHEATGGWWARAVDQRNQDLHATHTWARHHTACTTQAASSTAACKTLSPHCHTLCR